MRADDRKGDERAQSYYRQFYERRALGRVWSREHTGLLERKSREDLELEFKERPRPDAPNMLSCTPTLEMGIDIGDLSATMLCSVPPSASSYLQRVGRAGRSTGNALILTFASTQQHDLYFYDDPLAVMEGAIRPPGCYLDAPEVLKRQALAFCFDRWAATDHKLPGRVREMLGSGKGDQQFPGPIVRFIHERRDALRTGFFELFGRKTIRAESRAKLEALFDGHGPGESALERRLVRAVEDARKRRDELKALSRRAADRRRLLETDEIAAKKVPNLEEELRELRAEQGYLMAELTALLDEDLWGWLCDASLLPNYAFPEAGVTLRAFVRAERGLANDADDRSRELSWTRAPATAIQELAPFNTFYGSGYKVQIHNIDLPTREMPPKWQFCADCHHLEPVAELQDGDRCPACGAEGWGERGRQRQLIQMTRVRSFSRERDAVVSDETEDRQRRRWPPAPMPRRRSLLLRDAQSDGEPCEHRKHAAAIPEARSGPRVERFGGFQ
jgi:DEAD/DEAH box helicase domain-containing protein